MHLINFNKFARLNRHVTTIALVIAAMTVSLPSFAQRAVLDLDEDHSVAELFVGSPGDAYSFSPGYAHLSGEMVLNLDVPSKTLLDVHIYPAGVTDDARGNIADQMEFLSKNAVLLKDGSLAVSGDLAVTRVERSVSAEPSEAYSGQVYGTPVVRTSHRYVTFIFDAAQVAQAKRAANGVSAETRIARKDFPELLASIMSIDWPAVVQDKKCEAISNSGSEDYAGSKCSAVVLAPNNRIVASGAPGEDYSGIKVVPPSGDQVTIRLALRTLHRTEVSGAMNGE